MNEIPVKVICEKCGEKLEAEINTNHFEVEIKVTPCDCGSAATCANCAAPLDIDDNGEVTPCSACTCNAGCNDETKELMRASTV